MEVRKGYKQTEAGVIPNDWVAINLSNVCTLQRGFDITEATRVAGTIPVYSSSGLSYYHNKPMVFPPGVVTGRKGNLGKVFFINEPFWPHDTTLWVKDFKGNYPAYVALVLENFHLERLDAATSVPTLNRNNLAGYIVAIPSTLAEQKAIAEALSDADALIEAVEQILAKKRQVKQGAMSELLTGKRRLVESGEWEVKTIGEIAYKFLNGGTPSTKKEEYWEGNIPWITGADFIDQKVADIRRFITTEAVNNSATNVIEKGNLLVVTRTGVGKIAIAPFDLAISQDITGVYVKKEYVLPEFLFWYFYYNTGSLRNLNQGTSISGITRDTLTSLSISLPSLPEQTAIAEILSDMDAEISALEEKLVKARQVKAGMMSELLTGRIRLI